MPVCIFATVPLWVDDHPDAARARASRDDGGRVIPKGGMPIFASFVYVSIVIGMTCQTADLSISPRRIRPTVTVHGVFAFFLNLGVRAMVVNVLASVL